MIHNLSNNLISFIISYTSIRDTEVEEKATYTLEVILTDLSKMIIMYILFSFLGFGKDFLLIFVLSGMLRINLGGYHLDSYLSCLMFSSIYTFCILMVNKYVYIPMEIQVFSILLLSIVLLKITPVLYGSRVNFSKEQIGALRFKTFTLVCIYFLCSLFFKNHYSMYGFWIVLIQVIIIILMKGGKNYVKKIKS